MRIKILNPNTTTTFTELSLNAGRAVAAPGTEILAGQPSSGTPSVECHVDEAVATLRVIEAVQARRTRPGVGIVTPRFCRYRVPEGPGDTSVTRRSAAS